jgi:hypothetical protein
MTTAERIKRIADKAKVSYNAIKIIVYSVYGKTIDDSTSFENKLNLLEKQYGIQ